MRLPRGDLAVGLMRAGKGADAIREFKAAPDSAASRENADDDDATVVAGAASGCRVSEAYIKLLTRTASGDVAADTFSFGSDPRPPGGAATAPAPALRSDPAPAELVRTNRIWASR
jgi:hypothetical protein